MRLETTANLQISLKTDTKSKRQWPVSGTETEGYLGTVIGSYASLNSEASSPKPRKVGHKCRAICTAPGQGAWLAEVGGILPPDVSTHISPKLRHSGANWGALRAGDGWWLGGTLLGGWWRSALREKRQFVAGAQMAAFSLGPLHSMRRRGDCDGLRMQRVPRLGTGQIGNLAAVLLVPPAPFLRDLGHPTLHRQLRA